MKANKAQKHEKIIYVVHKFRFELHIYIFFQLDNFFLSFIFKGNILVLGLFKVQQYCTCVIL
jgi:hypothetical protein